MITINIIKCEHCNHEIRAVGQNKLENFIQLIQWDKNKKKHYFLMFHTSCFQEVAGNHYIPVNKSVYAVE